MSTNSILKDKSDAPSDAGEIDVRVTSSIIRVTMCFVTKSDGHVKDEKIGASANYIEL